MGLFHKLGHKSKDVGNRLGHKIKRGVHHTGKFIKPAIVLGTAALALHQATKPARETRTLLLQNLLKMLLILMLLFN